MLHRNIINARSRQSIPKLALSECAKSASADRVADFRYAT
jgi:hypothetical protein